MSGKILAILLLLVGGAITLYVLYQVLYAIIEPAVTRKLEEKMVSDKINGLHNNLKLQQYVDAIASDQAEDQSEAEKN